MVLDGLLSFSAAPGFAAMGLFAVLDSNRMLVAFCSTTPRGPHLPEMAAMYALMSLYHLKPWLSLLTDRER